MDGAPGEEAGMYVCVCVLGAWGGLLAAQSLAEVCVCV